jgi:glycosyltransferase involved in cell wall biosynthesis
LWRLIRLVLTIHGRVISFIIPAHNEEFWIGRCLDAVGHAMERVGEAHEVIVVEDSSTDATATIARQHGARVIGVAHRQISATRNAGANEARGDVFFFVDADTLIGAEVIQSGLRRIREGAVGGGCVPRFEGQLPLWWMAAYPLLVAAVRLLRRPGGACLFCTRAAFEATGGFSIAHYAAEDTLFVSALRRRGRFVVLTEPVLTSGRNLRAHSFWSMVRLLTRLATRGPDGFRDRRGLDMWYRPLREKRIEIQRGSSGSDGDAPAGPGAAGGCGKTRDSG